MPKQWLPNASTASRDPIERDDGLLVQWRYPRQVELQASPADTRNARTDPRRIRLSNEGGTVRRTEIPTATPYAIEAAGDSVHRSRVRHAGLRRASCASAVPVWRGGLAALVLSGALTAGASLAPAGATTTIPVSEPPTGQTWSAQVVATDQLPALRAAATPGTANTTPSTAPTTAVSTSTAAPRLKRKPSPPTLVPVDSSAVAVDPTDAAAWAALRKCESGGRYDLNTGNGYYGAYQFALGTWRKLGYAGLPSDAAPAVQDEAARKLQAKLGWGQWPACSRSLGLR